MDQERLNWFRFSSLIKDVGTDVLRTLVVEHAQTPFLSDLMYFWLDKVQHIKDKNYALNQWRCFHQDFKSKDETCRRNLKSLLMSWKLPGAQKLTFSDQVHTLQKWKNDIENICLSSISSNVKDALLSWIKQIQDIIEKLKSMSIIFPKWTTGFNLLCQKSRQDLLEIIEKHFDDFLSSSRGKVFEWRFYSKKEIAKLESDRMKQFETWKKVSEGYFKLVAQNIGDLLTSWRESFSNADIPELKKLLDELETKTSEIDEKKLQMSCDTWHRELHNLFEKWLKTINQRDEELYIFHPLLSWGWREPFLEELKHFPSISSQQVKDFLVSEVPNRKLHKLKQTMQLSEQQYDKLCPSLAFPDLKLCDSTLLFIVLRHCLVYPPVQGWNEDPPESDQSLSADVLRLKACRKHIIRHIEATKIDQNKYDKLWLYARNVLCRLANRSGYKYEKHVSMKVDQMEKCSFNPDIESELRQTLTWCRDEIFSEFKGKVASPSCLNMLQTIKTVERQRFGLIMESLESYSHDMQTNEESTDSYSHDMQTDEERRRRQLEEEALNSIPESIRTRWRLGYEEKDLLKEFAAAVGGAIGLVRGIGRTLSTHK